MTSALGSYYSKQAAQNALNSLQGQTLSKMVANNPVARKAAIASKLNSGGSKSAVSKNSASSSGVLIPSANSASFVASGSTTLPSGFSEYGSILDSIKSMSNDVNEYNNAQAEKLREWQVQQNKIAMDFNAAEAAKNRDWQEYMSNTAHQREVADLQAAGLNPVLSATGGNGAAVSSGATAAGVTSDGAKSSADTSYNMALLNFLNNVMGYATSTAVAGIGAGSAMSVEKMREDYQTWSYNNQPTSWNKLLLSMFSNPNNASDKANGLLAFLKNLVKY